MNFVMVEITDIPGVNLEEEVILIGIVLVLKPIQRYIGTKNLFPEFLIFFLLSFWFLIRDF